MKSVRKARCELRGVRTLASEETRALSERLRPLGHQFIRTLQTVKTAKSLAWNTSSDYRITSAKVCARSTGVCGLVVMIGRCQRLDPGSIPGRRNFLNIPFLGISQKCSLRGSNPGPLAHKTNARPTELRERFGRKQEKRVANLGFDPRTFRL